MSIAGSSRGKGGGRGGGQEQGVFKIRIRAVTPTCCIENLFRGHVLAHL